MASPEKEQQWTGGVMFLCAMLQLVLVHIGYRVDRSKSVPYVSSATWAMGFGVLLGLILTQVSPKRASNEGLDPPMLFFWLLPPIILEAGFNTQRKGFFSNFLAICLLAGAGTIIATLVTGGLLFALGRSGFLGMTALPLAEALLYGALVSAIDPVATLVVLRKSHAPPLLFNLLFGESVINDAVAIVLVGIFQHSAVAGSAPLSWSSGAKMMVELVGISIGSVVLAALICYSSAFLLRHADAALHQYPTYEISTVLLSAYASYVAAQSVQLSGLLALFFSGVFVRHYHLYSISHSSAAAVTQILSTAAFLTENLIYLLVGASLVAYSSSFNWDWPFIGVSLVAIMIARAVNTFPLCCLANLWRSERIPVKYMAVIWFSGLRGSIAFALALNVRLPLGREDDAAVIRASTLVTVIGTTVLFGAMIGPLLRLLGLGKSSTNGASVGITDEATPLLAADVLTEQDVSFDSVDGARTWSVRELWVRLDEQHLKPIFGGNPRVAPS